MSRNPFSIHPLRESAARSAWACGCRWTWRDANGLVGGHTRTFEEAEAAAADAKARGALSPTEAA
jgi:hypothetical protein